VAKAMQMALVKVAKSWRRKKGTDCTLCASVRMACAMTMGTVVCA
jgi:hypothetical protein